MSASDLAAIVLAIVCLAATVALVVAVQSLVRTLRELRGVVDDLRDQTLPMVGELRNGVERVDHVIATAERITDTVDAASRLTSRAFTPPLIKTVSLMAGARRVLHRGDGASSSREITKPARSAADDTAHPGITK
jgi:hypothetical protein